MTALFKTCWYEPCSRSTHVHISTVLTYTQQRDWPPVYWMKLKVLTETEDWYSTVSRARTDHVRRRNSTKTNQNNTAHRPIPVPRYWKQNIRAPLISICITSPLRSHALPVTVDLRRSTLIQIGSIISRSVADPERSCFPHQHTAIWQIVTTRSDYNCIKTLELPKSRGWIYGAASRRGRTGKGGQGMDKGEGSSPYHQFLHSPLV